MASTMGWRPTRAGIIYLVIAIILAAIVFGVAWFVRERGDQARQQDVVEVAKENLEESSDTPVIAEEEEETSNEGTTGTGNDVAVTDTNNSGTQTRDSSAAPGTENSAAELPVTGPASNLATLVLIAVATYGLTSVIVSRRSARQL